MADRFYVSGPLVPGEYTLAGPEAHHLSAVCRAQPGDRVTLFNGDGHEYPAEVLGVGKKHVSLNILACEVVDRERSSPLELAVAMPKGDRGDVLVEKLTELGVTRLVPLLTERTVVQPKASRIEALRRAVIEASKQCGRNVLMEVTDPLSWRQYVTQADQPTARMLLHPSGAAMPGGNTAAVIAIGPEGGWTEAEVQMGIAAGWQVCSLGVRILRIETAAIAVAARIPG